MFAEHAHKLLHDVLMCKIRIGISREVRVLCRIGQLGFELGVRLGYWARLVLEFGVRLRYSARLGFELGARLGYWARLELELGVRLRYWARLGLELGVMLGYWMQD